MTLASLEPAGHSHLVPPARLVDVAARAGVSIKTVSNVVNAHPQVHQLTRTRVQAAIDELGYRPHAIGRQLRRGRTGIIALAVPDIAVPYFAELAGHVAAAAARRGLEVLVEQTNASLETERRLVDARDAGLVDGLLLSPVATTADELSARAATTPLVLIGEGPLPPDVDHVGMDDAAAAAEATRHLLSRGRREIAFLGGAPGGPVATSDVRRQGWADALVDAGRPPGASAHLLATSFTGACGAAVVADALTSSATFDAILCASDVLALGAMHELAGAGRAPGHDVAVVGWDDVAFAAWTTPSLTSVRPDLEAIAEHGLTMLVETIDAADPRKNPSGDGRPHQRAGRRVVVGHRLVVRESSAAAHPDHPPHLHT